MKTLNLKRKKKEYISYVALASSWYKISLNLKTKIIQTEKH